MNHKQKQGKNTPVTAAVKIAMALEHGSMSQDRRQELTDDLIRLKAGFTPEEYAEFRKRME
jgi:hypothetical protein